MNQSTEVIKIDDANFGELIQMPKIFEKNKMRVETAEVYTAQTLALVEGIDLTQVDGLEMEAKMAPIRELLDLLADAEREINAERKPHTQKMDDIKKLFTGLENRLGGLTEKAKAKVNAWEGEKYRRQQTAQKETQRLADKAEEKVRIKSRFIQSLNDGYTRAILAEILGMNKAFNSKTADELPTYGEALLNWTPEMEEEFVAEVIRAALPPAAHHDTNEITAIRHEATVEVVGGLRDQWRSRVSEDKQRLVDLIPSRITELQEAAANQDAADAMKQRETDEAAQLTQQVTQEGSAMQEVAESNQQTEALTAVANVAVQATPVVRMASGSSVKKKYKVSTHAGMVALLQSYVKNDLAKLTPDEVNTKFSFIRTACDKRLNQANPEEIKAAGLEVVEDITTRRGGSKTA